MPPKPKNPFPCLRCNERVPKGSKGIQCLFCELWVHQTCSGVTDEQYKVIYDMAQNGGGHYWVCASCKAGSKLLRQQIVQMDKRLATLQDTVTDNTKQIEVNKDDIGKLNNKIDAAQARNNESSAAVEDAVFSELSDREGRKSNIIVYKIQEQTDTEDPAEKKEKDSAAVTEVLKIIDSDMKVSDVKFCSRIGKNKDEPRPLLVGLKKPEARKTILENAYKLAKSDKRYISIAPDLTARQRKEEANLKKEADQRNKELTEEERSLNYQWRLAGIRGERRLVKVKIKEGQEARKRQRSPEMDRAERNTRPRNNPQDLQEVTQDY